MSIENLLKKVEKKWHADFLNYVDSGEASQDFLDAVDKDAGLESLVEGAFALKVAAFEPIAKSLMAEPIAARAARTALEELQSAPAVTKVSTEFTIALEGSVAIAAAGETADLIEAVAKAVRRMGPLDRGRVREVVGELDSVLATVK